VRTFPVPRGGYLLGGRSQAWGDPAPHAPWPQTPGSGYRPQTGPWLLSQPWLFLRPGGG